MRVSSDESTWCMPECGLIIKSNCILFHVTARKLKFRSSLGEEIMNGWMFGSLVKFHRNCMNSRRVVILESKHEVLSVLLVSVRKVRP